MLRSKIFFSPAPVGFWRISLTELLFNTFRNEAFFWILMASTLWSSGIFHLLNEWASGWQHPPTQKLHQAQASDSRHCYEIHKPPSPGARPSCLVWADVHAEAHAEECVLLCWEHTEKPTPSCRPLSNRYVPAQEHISHGDDYCWLETVQDIAHNRRGRRPWGSSRPTLIVSCWGSWGPVGSSNSWHTYHVCHDRDKL